MAATTASASSDHQVLLLSLLCLLLLLQCSASPLWGGSRRAAPVDCGFDRLEALEPLLKVRSEAGSVEYFERYGETEEQLRCAGVLPIRLVVDPRGLLLPRYTNAHALVYILQGRGVVGFSFPGCPDTCDQQRLFQHCEQARSEIPPEFGDERQQIHRFGEGDVVAMPAGAQHWLYSDGDEPVVAVYVFDTTTNFNQLEHIRKFLLAGSFSKEQVHYAESVFKGFSIDFLSETLGVSVDVARKLQSQNDGRGEIVRVEYGLQLASSCPGPAGRQCPQAADEYALDDESVCTMEVTRNIEHPDERADTYEPRVARITRLNSNKFPILDLIQMSATRVDLYQNASLSPFWNINAHSVMYTIQGRARVQVVDGSGRRVFDGVLRPGQLLIVPQNYVIAAKAEDQGFRYISFETNPNALVSHIAGKNSVFGTLPDDVIASSYGISRVEAAELKNSGRHDLDLSAPNVCVARGEE